MTDEEIEKTMGAFANDNGFKNLCYKDMSLQHWFKIFENYIYRLKIRVQELGSCNVKILEREANKIRKDKATSILQECLDYCKGQGGVCYDIDIKQIAQKHGVEVNK